MQYKNTSNKLFFYSTRDLFIYLFIVFNQFDITIFQCYKLYSYIIRKKKQNNGKSSICLKDLAKNKRTADGADRDIPKQ